jgi:lipopolysaccharide biosynthesis glycosyltransferase
MALRKLVGGNPGSDRGTSLAFAFDANYAPYFRTLARSMMEHDTLIDCPIIVYTADPEVFEDPFIAKVVDKRRLIEPDLVEKLGRAAQETVKRPERATWNLGTFLKWAVFEEQETAQVLFLDVDMIFRARIEPLLTEKPDHLFLCAPQFQRSIGALPHPAKGIQRLLDGNMWGSHVRRINSGVMLIRGALLSASFRDDLLAHAFSTAEAINEQSHMSIYFAEPENDGLRAMVSAKYNFQEGYLRLVPPEDRIRLSDQAIVLHYAGGAKPWKSDPATLRESQREWFRYEDKISA